MANPFQRADRHGAPSIRPTPPESAETPMPEPVEGRGQFSVNRPESPLSAETPMVDPSQGRELTPETRDLPVNRPVAPPSAEMPMNPPPAPPPSTDNSQAES